MRNCKNSFRKTEKHRIGLFWLKRKAKSLLTYSQPIQKNCLNENISNLLYKYPLNKKPSFDFKV